MTDVRLAYLICTTPRSGSTLLCEALANTGVAGRPEEYYQHRRKTRLPRRPLEYFEEPGAPDVVDVLGHYSRVDEEWLEFDPRRFPSYADYLRWTIERATTPNGVFGAKVMWGYFNGFVDGLRDVHGTAVMPTRAVVERTFPHLRGWILLRRADKVRQAVSLWKAIQNWTWRRDAEDGHVVRHELVYSFEALAHLARQLEQHEREWVDFFDASGIEPYTVTYERFADDYAGTVVALLEWLGIPVPAHLGLERRRMARQADELSEAWVARYRADERLRAHGVGGRS